MHFFYLLFNLCTIILLLCLVFITYTILFKWCYVTVIIYARNFMLLCSQWYVLGLPSIQCYFSKNTKKFFIRLLVLFNFAFF